MPLPATRSFSTFSLVVFYSVGTYQDQQQKTSCKLCGMCDAPHRESPNALTCVVCVCCCCVRCDVSGPGTFQNSEAGDQCFSCLAGAYNEAFGARLCTPCK